MISKMITIQLLPVSLSLSLAFLQGTQVQIKTSDRSREEQIQREKGTEAEHGFVYVTFVLIGGGTSVNRAARFSHGAL